MEKTTILNKAKHVFEENNFNVFYLVESGSRLWGFESKDSDYDLRGFFLYNLEKEFSLKKKDYFEFLEKDEKFDLVLFHLDKAFLLLYNSNPSVIEWLIATKEDVYIDTFNLRNFFSKIKNLISLKSLYFHYISLARKNWNQYFLNNNKPTTKKIIYVYRGLISAKYIYEYKSIPPIKFLDLCDKILDKKMFNKIEKIVENKKKGFENQILKDKEILLFVENMFFELTKEKGLELSQGNKEKLFECLNKKTIDIKRKILLH